MYRKERIINFFLPKNIINSILSGEYPLILCLFIFLMDCTRTLRFYIKYHGNFKGLQNIEWLPEYNIPAKTFNWELKRDGISAYARLKNASDFLEVSVTSLINYVDEIILVENGSTDNTREICNSLHKKYPGKIRIFQYTPKVYPLFSDDFKNCPENSVHNFAYMSNFALSKVSYKYAIKMDDDGLFLGENMKTTLRNIRDKGLDYFHITPLINVQRYKEKFVIGGSNYRSSFSGLLWDIGIHPVSPRIYFHSNGKTEWYVHNYRSKFGLISFLHLKLLKKSRGFSNYDKKWLNYLNTTYTDISFIPLEIQYITLLHQYNIYEDW